MKNLLDKKRRIQIFGAFKQTKEVEKAYTEGIYADTPANRKLGRVGMSYTAYAEKIKNTTEKDNKSENLDIEKVNISVSSTIPTKYTLSKRCSKENLNKLKENVEIQLKKANEHLNENKKHYGEQGVASERAWLEANIKRGKNLINNIDSILNSSPSNKEQSTDISFSKEGKKEEDKSLFHNEQKLNESLSKISELEKQKSDFKEDKDVLELLDNDIQKEKDKIEKICPNYNRAYKYANQILDTDDGNRGKEINVPKDCVESIQFLLKFEGLSSSEYKLNKTEKGYYISLI